MMRIEKIVYILMFCIVIIVFFVFEYIKAGTLSVPFITQAPTGNWQQPWKDACEETSIFMVDAYYNNVSFNTEEAKKKILKIFEIKNKVYGKSFDENAEKIVSLINNYLKWESYIVENPTIEQIKQEIDDSHPVIIPAHGKSLKNHFFKDGGPVYHVFVLSGYDDEKKIFINQEPGTQYGKNLQYSYEIVLNAMHDYLPKNQTLFGKKVAIFTRPTLDETFAFDADKDGLTKEQEIQYGTDLFLKDTDSDGYTDGMEVETGFSPIVNENELKQGALVKIADSSDVYFIEKNQKELIKNDNVFKNNEWNKDEIVIVSERFLNSFYNGETLEE